MTRLISSAYDNLFPRGWSGGYASYRYGEDASKVYNPAKRPKLARQYLTGAIVAEVVEILRDVPAHVSVWSREGETRTGLRRGLLSDGAGLTWQTADDTAAELIRRAFSAMRVAARPAWDDGQRFATLDEQQCVWCAKPLDHGGRYCCAEHARLALEHFDYETNWGASPVGRAAYRIIRREREEERECEHCHRPFKPMSADSEQRFCSQRCHYRAMVVHLPERDCEHCGAPFHPNEPGQRFCSQAHATAALRKDNERTCARDGCGNTFKPTHGDDPERDKYCSATCATIARQTPKHPAECGWCGNAFLAKTRAARFCCDAHAQAHRKAARGHLPALLSAPAFDFTFAHV